MIPTITEGTKPVFIPAIQVFHQVRHFLLIWRKERDRERLATLCRYLIATLESDSPKFSYVGVALNKDHVLQWIVHMNDILWKCCGCIADLKPELASDMKTILLYLHMLVSFTCINTWAILRSKGMEPLKPGMNQLCANLMGNLFHRGFYLTLKVMNYHYNIIIIIPSVLVC